MEQTLDQAVEAGIISPDVDFDVSFPSHSRFVMVPVGNDNRLEVAIKHPDARTDEQWETFKAIVKRPDFYHTIGHPFPAEVHNAPIGYTGRVAFMWSDKADRTHLMQLSPKGRITRHIIVTIVETEEGVGYKHADGRWFESVTVHNAKSSAGLPINDGLLEG